MTRRKVVRLLNVAACVTLFVWLTNSLNSWNDPPRLLGNMIGIGFVWAIVDLVIRKLVRRERP